MEEQDPLDMPAEYWYGKPGEIEHWFYGVFEGGGAKGVAHSGALLAMAEKKCWFRAVAGASAGAITAALVAAGSSPDEMDAATDSALKKVQTGVWAGLWGLQSAKGYYPTDALRDWLNTHFNTQISIRTGTKPGEEVVTFRELYAATNIELNVVAADLSLGSQLVFSHIETPNCSVADAVVASSSIPFAFASRLLYVAEGENSFSHHTIVDGGVWSNFPMYIFEDEAFRRFYNRKPKVIEPRRVVGFLLQESAEQEPPRGEDVMFVEATPGKDVVLAKEWFVDSKTVVDVRAGTGSKVAAWLLFPFSLLGRFLEWNGGVERGRWPTPRSRLANNLVYSINGLLGGIYAPLLGVLACAVVAVGAWQVVGFLVSDQLTAISATNWTEPMSYVVRPFSLMLTLLGVAIAILILFATLLGVVVNRILLRTARRILYGLVTTYVAGSGAPEWAVVEKKNIIALPIPPTVNTLSFEMRAEERQDLIASARQATLARLTDILSEEKRTD